MVMVFDRMNESRLYTRVNARLPVSIIYNAVPIAECFTRNISIGGLFVEVHELGLSVNSLIEIRFNVDVNHLLFNTLIPAIVKRIDEDGFVVAFERIEKAAEDLIIDSIKNSRSGE